MLSAAEALALVRRHLGTTPRAAHTRVVAYVMGRLAVHFGQDRELWEVVGLCHDLDYVATARDRSRHKLLTIDWLGGRLSEDAKQAIAAHDHRTGVEADTLLADMLKLADAMVVIDERLGRDVWRALGGADPFAVLRSKLGERAYLGDIVQSRASKRALPLQILAALMTDAPLQS